MKTFVLASKNKHKAEEIRQILGEEFEILTMDEAGVGELAIIEDGSTFEENAAKKAETVMRVCKRPTIADDSGLCVEALEGAPGVYTARYAGPYATDEDNIQKLLEALKDVPPMERGASFVCVIALAEPGADTRLFRGECNGKIAQEKKGESGFGYDPVFYVEQYGKTMAELEHPIKNAISHRGAALKKLCAYLKD